jgi:hypothetical protein
MTKISGRAGVTVFGTVTDPGSFYVWMFDFDSNDGLFLRDTEAPIRAPEGKWNFPNQPIGDEGTGDIGAAYTLFAVRASKGCNAKILALPVNKDGDVVVEQLPAGCPQLGEPSLDIDSVVVIKARR